MFFFIEGKALVCAVQFHKKLLLDGQFLPYNSKRKRLLSRAENTTSFHIFFTAHAIHFHI